jgi:hypothetical protein
MMESFINSYTRPTADPFGVYARAIAPQAEAGSPQGERPATFGSLIDLRAIFSEEDLPRFTA